MKTLMLLAAAVVASAVLAGTPTQAADSATKAANERRVAAYRAEGCRCEESAREYVCHTRTGIVRIPR